MIVGPRLPARCSQWMPSSKNASPPAIVSSLRQSSAVLRRCAIVVKCANTISPIAPLGEQPPQRDRQRLVVIVLADEHDAAGAVARVAHGLVVRHRRERRLLDEHVLARGERLQRQVEMEPRRHGDDDRVDVRIVDRGRVVAVAARRRQSARQKRSALRAVAAGVAQRSRRRRRARRCRLWTRGDEAAAEEGDAQRCGHQQHRATTGPPVAVDRVYTDFRALRALEATSGLSSLNRYRMPERGARIARREKRAYWA